MPTTHVQQQPFVIVELEHKNCAECTKAADAAESHARATGSTGATWVDDGRALTPPRYHRAVVARTPGATR